MNGSVIGGGERSKRKAPSMRNVVKEKWRGFNHQRRNGIKQIIEASANIVWAVKRRGRKSSVKTFCIKISGK